jgi:hypothetical protein
MFSLSSASIYHSCPRPDQATERPTLTPEQERWRAAYPVEFKDGAKLGFNGSAEAPREPGLYPRGFLDWDGDRKDAWYCGWYAGYVARRHQ